MENKRFQSDEQGGYLKADLTNNYWGITSAPNDTMVQTSANTDTSNYRTTPVDFIDPPCQDIPIWGIAPQPPQPTPTPPVETPTLEPSATPTATSPIDDPAYLASIFPPPMDPSNVNSNYVPRLSDLELANRTNIVPALCSRDVNPFDTSTQTPVAGSGFNLIAPADSEVILIDTSFSGQANEGLGIFVVIRIDTSQLPTEIWTRLVNQYGLSEQGFIYIGYAHLQSVSPSIINDFNGSPLAIPEGTIIGLSGSTSTASAHLDVTVYYLAGSSRVQLPRQAGSLNSPPQSQLPNWFQAFYRIYSLDINETIFVDPLILWPILAENSASDYNTLIAQVCS